MRKTLATAVVLVMGALALSACESDSPGIDPDTIVKELSGTWERNKSYVCAGVNWTDSGIAHSLNFSEKSYSRDVLVQGLCGAKRKGAFSITQNILTLGFSSINCDSSNLCPAGFTIKQGSEDKSYNFDCPGVLKTDGQTFIMQFQDGILSLTPRDGLDQGCTYTYTKKQ